MPENAEVYNLMSMYGPAIFNGDQISTTGIQHAMEWFGVVPNNFSITAEKIILFYKIINNQHIKQREKESKQHASSKTNPNRS